MASASRVQTQATVQHDTVAAFGEVTKPTRVRRLERLLARSSTAQDLAAAGIDHDNVRAPIEIRGDGVSAPSDPNIHNAKTAAGQTDTNAIALNATCRAERTAWEPGGETACVGAETGRQSTLAPRNCTTSGRCAPFAFCGFPLGRGTFARSRFPLGRSFLFLGVRLGLIGLTIAPVVRALLIASVLLVATLTIATLALPIATLSLALALTLPVRAPSTVALPLFTIRALATLCLSGGRDD